MSEQQRDTDLVLQLLAFVVLVYSLVRLSCLYTKSKQWPTVCYEPDVILFVRAHACTLNSDQVMIQHIPEHCATKFVMILLLSVWCDSSKDLAQA